MGWGLEADAPAGWASRQPLAGVSNYAPWAGVSAMASAPLASIRLFRSSKKKGVPR